ncbi:uroporphyrinogen-III C-methyltransferase [bacterium SCSIO 12696]|nr:uroporphyrinogen-III C-methyltransferase [bacterium SCSIO 12696]
MNYFPIFANLDNKHVLVVGAGSVASRKIELLRKTNAHIHVVAIEASEQINQWHQQGMVQLQLEAFEPTHLDGKWLVIAATNNRAVNRNVEQAAVARQLLANVVDDRKLSHFIVPSIIDRDPIQIAISSGGEAPVLARSLRADLEARLPASLGKLAVLMGNWRDRVKQRFTRPGQRREFWERVLSSSVPQQLFQGDKHKAEQGVLQMLNGKSVSEKGHVSLVGAGPGDPELLTLKAMQRLQTADVVYYDNLVSDEVLELVRRDAERIYVGKKAGAHSCSQTHIQEQLRDAALSGKRVVRLKGGDPFVFGRGGEELEVLAQAGVSFDVVPGITAAAATAAYTGIPLTHRDYAHSAILVTGHGKENTDIDWQALARTDQTLAIYMGLKKSSTIAEQLIAHGRAADTPVVIVERATTERQRQISGKLRDLPQLIASYGVESPAMILVGEVCELAGRYAWFGEPLQPVECASGF